MDNNELLNLFPELRHEWFNAKIKKPMEPYFHASSNISMNSLNTIVDNDIENSKLGEVGFDENDLFSPPVEEKVYVDYDMPPIYDDYNDSGLLVPPTMEDKCYYDYTMPPIFDDENNNDSYFVEFAPTTINKNDYAYVGSNDTFMHVNKNALCESYIVEFVHDATESYYERGKYGYMHLNNIKLPLFMLRIWKLLVFYPLMLVTLFFMNSFVYKIPLHRKHVRLRCVLNLPLDALFCFTYYLLRVHH